MQIIGFGISKLSIKPRILPKDAIIGSAFIKNLIEKGVESIGKFVKAIR